MSTPEERTRALYETRRFLQELCIGDVSEAVRRDAQWCLRHYPTPAVIDVLARHAPGWLVPAQGVAATLAAAPMRFTGEATEALPPNASRDSN